MDNDIIDILEYIRRTYHEDDEDNDEIEYEILRSIRNIEQRLGTLESILSVDETVSFPLIDD